MRPWGRPDISSRPSSSSADSACSTRTRRSRAALEERGRLWHRETFAHQYPHCWRCHNPVIFLATSQWFISLDEARLKADTTTSVRLKRGHCDEAKRTVDARRVEPTARLVGAGLQPDRVSLREAAKDAIDHQVKWIPAWGHDRIYNMVANRPDWCVSRQRAWGVPIPAVDCTSCGEAISRRSSSPRRGGVFETYGADAWYERPTADFIPARPDLRACGGTSFEREMNILDVWFDSGSSHEAVLSVRPELTWPADVYLEGTDQHRGWFQSSLLVGLGTRGRPPFKTVVTNGFVVADDGRKMSKSLGNSIEPEDIIKESGADILRLWVSMSDYTQELRISKEILARVAEAYRKLRNTLALPGGKPLRLRPRGRLDAVRADRRDRSVHARALRPGRTAHSPGLRGLRLLDHLSGVEHLHDRRPELVLQRHLEGSPLHVRGPIERAAIGADGDVPDRRRPDPFDGADSLVHGRRAVAVSSGRTRRVGPHRRISQPSRPGAARRPGVAAALGQAHALRERVVAEIEPLRKDKRIGSSLQAKVVLSASPEDFEFLTAARARAPDVVHRVGSRAAEERRCRRPRSSSRAPRA